MSALATKDLLRKILPARLYSFETKYAHGDDSLLCIFTVNKKQREKGEKNVKAYQGSSLFCRLQSIILFDQKRNISTKDIVNIAATLMYH